MCIKTNLAIVIPRAFRQYNCENERRFHCKTQFLSVFENDVAHVLLGTLKNEAWENSAYT